MRKLLVALLASLVVGIGAAAAPAGAGRLMFEFEVTPTEGEAGTGVVFDSLDACPNFNSGGQPNAFGDVYAAIATVPDPSSSDFIADTIVDSAGDWSIPYTIDAAAPPGDLTFYAFCLEDFTQVPTLESQAIPEVYEIIQNYNPVTFTVTVPATTTTTSTTTSTSTTTTTVPAPTITANPTTVYAGDSVAVQASGFAPNSNVVITLESDPVNLGTYVADSAGKIATSIVVPANFPTGAHTIKLTGTDIASKVLVLSTGITVASRIQVTSSTAAPTTVAVATTSTLPQTGSSLTEPALVAAGALILAGGGALLVARRRRAANR